MNLDQQLLELDNVTIEPFEDIFHFENSITHAFETAKIGCFRWDFIEKKVYVSNVIYNICNIDKTYSGSFLALIQQLFTKKQRFDFVEALLNVLNNGDSITYETQIYSSVANGLRWVKISAELSRKDQHYVIGTIQDIHDLKNASQKINALNTQLFQILKGIPLPIYYYDNVGNVIYTNEMPNKKLEYINTLIEKYEHNQKNVFDEYDTIFSFEAIMFDPAHRQYRLLVSHQNNEVVLNIHRILITSDDEVIGMLYIHEDITEGFEQQTKMQKILKVNELTIEIKDIVDNIDDIQSLYDFVLSRIPTVIPSVKRACVLRLNREQDMYMAANYGYDSKYQMNLKLPYSESFANLSLRGDYSKSIIINDIQKKFAVMYPDINENQHGFKMESNMVAPLLINGELYGLISVDSDQNFIFDEVDLNLIDYIRIQLERSIRKYQHFSQVKRNSILDSLTGIFNRRHLIELYEDYATKADNMNKSFTFVMFDIDDLKNINDTYGHLAGDEVIKQFAFIANKQIREVDIIARYGGDEFIAMFWDIPKEILVRKLEYWQKILRVHPIIYDSHSLTTEFSYGISSYPEDGQLFENLLDVADKEMYRYKEKGQ